MSNLICAPLYCCTQLIIKTQCIFSFSANRGEEKDEEGGSDAEQARQHRNPQEHDDHDEGEGEDHDEGLGEDRGDDGDDNQS